MTYTRQIILQVKSKKKKGPAKELHMAKTLHSFVIKKGEDPKERKNQ